MPPERIRACLAEAAASPQSAAGFGYPAWYLHRWHFLPEGYLSRRSVTGYDQVIRRAYSMLREDELLRRAAHWLRAARPRTVVELGCGPGRAVEAVARVLPAAQITGIDLSPFMLERAARRAPKDGGVALLHGDATNLALGDGSADAVVAFHLLGHLPRQARAAAIDEAARILRAGGLLLVADHRWHPPVRHAALELSRRGRIAGLIDLCGFVRR